MATWLPGGSDDEPGLSAEAAGSESAAAASTARPGWTSGPGDGSEPPRGEPSPAESGAIGETLRKRRAERGLTLSDSERDTRISRSYLQALEAERWDALPAPVYTRGFLRSYGRHLGLDPEELIAMLPAELPRPPGLEPLPGLLHRETTLTLDLLNTRTLVAVVVAFAVVVAATVLVLQIRAGTGDAEIGVPVETASVAATVPPAEPGTAPDFTGVTLETARERLTALGITPNVIEVITAEAPAGEVFAQTPAAGEPLHDDITVTLVVSAGTP